MEKISINANDGTKGFLNRFKDQDMTTSFNEMVRIHSEMIKEGVREVFSTLRIDEFSIIYSIFNSTWLINFDPKQLEHYILNELENPYELMFSDYEKLNKIADKIKGKSSVFYLGIYELLKRIKAQEGINIEEKMKNAGVNAESFKKD